MCDSKGLVTTTRGDELPKHKQVMARKDDGSPDTKDLREVVEHVKPHAIVGLTGGGEAWGKVRSSGVQLVKRAGLYKSVLPTCQGAFRML